MLTTTLPAEPGDGTPEFVLELAKHMDAEVTILAPRAKGCPRAQQMGDVSVIRFGYGPRFAESLADDAILPAIRQRPQLALQVPGLLLSMAVNAWTTKRLLDPDVLHAHWIIPGGLIGAALTARNSCQLLVTAHGADAFALNDPFSLRVKRFVLRRADRVHAVSSDIAQHLTNIEPTIGVHVAPIGVDVEAVALATENRQPNGRLLFVGRLAEKKGVDDLLRALALLRDQYNVLAPLDIVGDGPLRQSLEGLADDLDLADQVTFHGAESRSNVLERYRVAELLVMPSKTASDGDRDGTPVVLMEAIAAQLPVVATEVGGIAELLDGNRTAWLVPEGADSELADALDQALRSTTRATVADVCLQDVRDRIDVSRIARSLMNDAAA